MESNSLLIQYISIPLHFQISTTDSSMEPSRKIQRTFPPADIRNEALSVPNTDKVQPSSQTDTSIQTNSSITIEPFKSTNNITKPTVKINSHQTSVIWLFVMFRYSVI